MRALGFAALLAPGLALAQGAPRIGPDAALAFPQLAGEIEMGLYATGTTHGPDRRREGTSTFLFGEIAAGLHLSPTVSIQAVAHVEPVGEADPNGGTIGFRRQGAFLEALYLDWRAAETLTLYAGKFIAPFGRGHHDFPGILPMIRAHEAYMIGEAAGLGATWTFLSHPVLGEHDLSVAAFTLDTSAASNTLFTRRACCAPGFERYSRNTREQGGAGNTGRLDNFAVALDGDGFAALPNLSYHLAMLSRGAGRDGTAREWGYTAGLRYEAAWTPSRRTLFFAETVQFRPAGGRPTEEIASAGDPDVVESVAVAERRRFTTLGARTAEGPWSVTVAWQQDERKRQVNPLPAETFLEVSVGRDLGRGFAIDVGYQHALQAREDRTRGSADALIGVLRFRQAL